MSLLCPELIGRAAEVASLRERVDAMAAGRGGVVVLVAGGGGGQDAPGRRHRGSRRRARLPGAHRARGAGPQRGALPRARRGVPRGVPLGAGARLPRARRARRAPRDGSCPGWRGDQDVAGRRGLAAPARRGRRAAAARPRRRAGLRPRGGGPALGRPGDPRRPRLPRRRAAHRARAVRGDRAARGRRRGAARTAGAPRPRRDRPHRAAGRGRRRPDGGGVPGHADARPPGSPASCAPTATARRSSSRSCSRAWSRRARCGTRTGCGCAAGELTPTVPASLRESIAAPHGAARRDGPAGDRRRRDAGPPVRLGAAAGHRRRRRASGRRRAAGRRRRADRRGRRRPASSSATRSPARPCWTTCSRRSDGGWPNGRGPRSNGRTPASRAPPASWPRSWRRRRARPRRPRSGWSRARGGRSPRALWPPPRARRAAPAGSPRRTSRWRRAADEVLVRVLVAAGKPVEARELGLALLPRLAAAQRADLLSASPTPP